MAAWVPEITDDSLYKHRYKPPFCLRFPTLSLSLSYPCECLLTAGTLSPIIHFTLLHVTICFGFGYYTYKQICFEMPKGLEVLNWFAAISLKFDRYKSLFMLHLYSSWITEASRSKAWTVFSRSNTDVVGSNLSLGMDVCVYVFLCVDGSVATGWSPSEVSYRLCIGSRNWRKATKAQHWAVRP
jgi:hypothetical protein